jgi:hypothetical protein
VTLDIRYCATLQATSAGGAQCAESRLVSFSKMQMHIWYGLSICTRAGGRVSERVGWIELCPMAAKACLGGQGSKQQWASAHLALLEYILKQQHVMLLCRWRFKELHTRSA